MFLYLLLPHPQLELELVKASAIAFLPLHLLACVRGQEDQEDFMGTMCASPLSSAVAPAFLAWLGFILRRLPHT